MENITLISLKGSKINKLSSSNFILKQLCIQRKCLYDNTLLFYRSGLMFVISGAILCVDISFQQLLGEIWCDPFHIYFIYKRENMGLTSHIPSLYENEEVVEILKRKVVTWPSSTVESLYV